MRPVSALLMLVMAGAMLAAVGCEKDPTPPPVNLHLEPTSEMIVLTNLRHAWQNKRIDWYGNLLADDFKFYFDAKTRARRFLPESWTRLDDSIGVAVLFASPYVRTITVDWTPVTGPNPVAEPGRETWTRIDALTFVEVVNDPTPTYPDGMTWRVNSSPQHFFIRKGRSPADTLATSPTARRYYLVEWVDLGIPDAAPESNGHSAGAAGGPGRFAPQATEQTTWGAIKTAYK